MSDSLPVDIFSTAPQSAHVEPAEYLEQAKQVARWSEEAGCKGILIYTDNRLIDPWLVAQVVIENTEKLCPLVATQPVYMHPYTVANMIASFGYLYGRQIFLNMVAGGFKNDLIAMGDDTPHDARYERMQEYTQIILGLLAGETVTLEGRFYNVKNLSLKPELDPALKPGILLSGSSEAGRATAAALDATAVEYPKPGEEYGTSPDEAAQRAQSGIRVGLIPDDDEEKAWEIAHERFPEDRRGQLAHQMAMKVTDSSWHKQLGEMDDKVFSKRNPYWLFPFKNYKTFCPYLVGSYETVGEELAKYLRAGFKTYIVDIPATADDLQRTGKVFRKALECV